MSILEFWKNFNFTSDVNSIREFTFMLLIHIFIRTSGSEGPNGRLSADFNIRKSSQKMTIKSRYLTTNP